MSEVSPKLVQELRRKTGAGMMDCKAALLESNGDMDAAIEYLRKKGLKSLDKRAARVAAEGCVGVYVHPGDQIVALVELNCETDFVARGDDFKALARDIAMQVCAMKPRFLSEAHVPAEVIEKEKEILLEQLSPEQRSKADKILPGRITKFVEENCLLSQGFVKDDSGKVTIKNLLENYSLKCGEKVEVRRFARFEVGEDVEKTQGDLAGDVAAMLGGAH